MYVSDVSIGLYNLATEKVEGACFHNIVESSTISEIAVASSGFKIDSARYIQYGKIAMAHFQITATANKAAGNQTILTLVSGKRPATAAPFCTMANFSTSSNNPYGNQDGTIRWNTGAISSGGTCYICGTYILQ